MVISKLFRWNLWKISQQIGVNLIKKRSNFGLIWVVSGAPGGPTPHNFFFFWLEMLNYVPL